jgi:hypothetical protein
MRDGWITVFLNGAAVSVAAGTTVAAAMFNAGLPCRTSVRGEARAALCGMGICFECRATVDGRAHQRTCQLPCREGMLVETQP